MLLLLPAALAAQPAALVPASSQIYDRIEALHAFFPTRGVVLAERLVSRRQLEVVLARLSESVERDRRQSDTGRDWARREISAIREALEDRRGMRSRGRVVAGGSWRTDVFATDALAERIGPNGLGSIDAVTHPFASDRHGWPVLKGTAATLAPTGALGFGAAAALVAQPLVTLSSQREQGWTSERFFHRLYARATRWNIAARVGAEELRWGHSPNGALFMSGSAMPMPAVALGTDTAFTPPWLFRLVGPTRFTIMAAHQGPFVPRGAVLAAWHATFQPWTRFEVGVSTAAQSGGDGAPSATFLERLVDLFPLIDALHPAHGDLQISNKFAGGSLRLRFPELSGSDIYYELQFDDFDARRLRSTVVDDAAQLLGVRVPVLIGDQLITWRGEYHRTSLRLYQHVQFPSGYTYRSRIIGSPLGPHAGAAYSTITWRSQRAGAELLLGEEARDPSQYTVSTSGPRDRGFVFTRVTDEPDHRRRRVQLEIARTGPLGHASLRVGYNRAWRSGQGGRDEWMALVSLSTRSIAAF